MSDLQLLPISGELLYTFDWTADVPSGVTVTSIDYVLPLPANSLVQFADSDDLANRRGTIGLRVGSVGRHGHTYQVEAQAVLSNAERVPKYLTVRID